MPPLGKCPVRIEGEPDSPAAYHQNGADAATVSSNYVAAARGSSPSRYADDEWTRRANAPWATLHQDGRDPYVQLRSRRWPRASNPDARERLNLG